MIPGKAPDKETQKKQVAKIKRLSKKARENQCVVLFTDPTHQIYNNVNGYCWQEIGRDNTKLALANSGRKRINIIGAINALTREPTTIITEENCNAAVIEQLLGQICQQYPDRTLRIHLFLDNARYHHNREVKKLAKRSNIKLEFLPAYSPNLNLIERLWKFLKKKVRKNKYYDTFEKFKKAVCEFFKNIDQYQSELKTLLTLNFEII